MKCSEYQAQGAEAIKNQLVMANIKTGKVIFFRGCVDIYTTDNKYHVTIYHRNKKNGCEFTIQTTSYGAIDPFGESSVAEVMKITGALFANSSVTKAIKDICQRLDSEELEED